MNKEYFSEADERFMRLASELAFDNIDKGGGPFGAVIVRDGEIVSTGVNTVTLTNDPTAHAEVNAIRAACASEKTFSLKGCTVYSSCEPCPMCLSALYWAGVSAYITATLRPTPTESTSPTSLSTESSTNLSQSV